MNPVQVNPAFPQMFPATPDQVVSYLPHLIRTLVGLYAEYGQRLNAVLPKDGTEAMTAPLPLMSYTVAGLPAASSYEGGLIYVSNETGGATLAFSDGTNWRRVQDRVVVS